MENGQKLNGLRVPSLLFFFLSKGSNERWESSTSKGIGEELIKRSLMKSSKRTENRTEPYEQNCKFKIWTVAIFNCCYRTAGEEVVEREE